MFGIANEVVVDTITQQNAGQFYLDAHDMIRNISGRGEGNGPFVSSFLLVLLSQFFLFSFTGRREGLGREERVAIGEKVADEISGFAVTRSR